MHELPQDLTQSLRSYRGSIYGDQRRQRQRSPAQVDPEAEKSSTQPYGDKEFERALGDTASSYGVQPTEIDSVTGHPRQPRDDWHHDLEKQQAVVSRNTSRHHSTHGNNNGHGHANANGNGNGNDNTKIHPAKRPTSAQSSHAGSGETKSEIYGPGVHDLDPAADRLARNLTPLTLADFCILMGIRRPTSTDVENIEKLAIKNGLYDKILRNMHSESRKFQMFDVATYLLLVVQLIISAVFIILGALEHIDTHITIAVLGAVATVLAGALALMKGQGLPNRLRQTRDGLRNVVFEADELFWDIRSGRPVVFKDIKKIREDYLRVLQQARAHHPDAWTDSADNVAQGAAGKTGRSGKK